VGEEEVTPKPPKSTAALVQYLSELVFDLQVEVRALRLVLEAKGVSRADIEQRRAAAAEEFLGTLRQAQKLQKDDRAAELTRLLETYEGKKQ
jgi:hypothetical protein